MNKIVLEDGKEIELIDLDKVIGCFVTSDDISFETFKNNMRTIMVVIDGVESTFHNTYLTFIDKDEETGKTRFGFREYSEEDLRQIKIRADIDYIAMMCDVEL